MLQNIGLFLALLRRLKLPRKVEAGIGITALILGQVFPEHSLLADMVAGAMLADSAARIKRRDKHANADSNRDSASYDRDSDRD